MADIAGPLKKPEQRAKLLRKALEHQKEVATCADHLNDLHDQLRRVKETWQASHGILGKYLAVVHQMRQVYPTVCYYAREILLTIST